MSKTTIILLGIWMFSRIINEYKIQKEIAKLKAEIEDLKKPAPSKNIEDYPSFTDKNKP